MGTLNETLATARTIRQDAEGEVRRAGVDVARAEALVATARKHGYATVTAHEAALASAQARLGEARRAEAAAKAGEAEAEAALAAAREARYAAREQALREQIGVVDGGDMTLRRDEYGARERYVSGRWVLALLKLDEAGAPVMSTYTRDGKTFTYAEKRFGYDADVAGPRQEWRGNWEPATVNWGTIGAVSVAEARDLLRVHEAAVKLAALLDEWRADWDAVDQAD